MLKPERYLVKEVIVPTKLFHNNFYYKLVGKGKICLALIWYLYPSGERICDVRFGDMPLPLSKHKWIEIDKEEYDMEFSR